MTVDDAFHHFRSSALAWGITELYERAHPEAFGSRVSTLRQKHAALRLVWDGKEEILSLEITNGPLESTGWLDLFQVTRHDDKLLPDQHDVTFESAVEHGFDLLSLSRSSGAP